MRYFKSVLYGFLLVIFALPVSADLGHADQNVTVRYQRIDRNGDGRVTRNEWRASADRSFDNHDWNGDGILMEDEITQWNENDDDWNRRPGRRYNRRSEWISFDTFRSMDRNGDGRVSQDEWRGSADEFDRLDTNRNGIVSVREFQLSRFERIDRDGDGFITRVEWRKSGSSFDTLDQNRDGKISRGEFVNRQQVYAVVFSELDVNGDRVVSRYEWRGMVEDFNRLDTNRDGRLSENEFYLRQTEITTTVGSTTDPNSSTSIIEQIFQQFLASQ